MSYRLALVDLRWSDALNLRVVEAVMTDGSTEPYERSDRTWLVRVADVKAPENCQCGAKASYNGAVALLNQLHGQEAGLVWNPQVREEVLAHADGDEYAAEQAEDQAASRGIWAECNE